MILITPDHSNLELNAYTSIFSKKIIFNNKEIDTIFKECILDNIMGEPCNNITKIKVITKLKQLLNDFNNKNIEILYNNTKVKDFDIKLTPEYNTACIVPLDENNKEIEIKI